MHLLMMMTILFTALTTIPVYGDNHVVKLSPYRAGKYMYVTTELLKIHPRKSYNQLSAVDKSRFRTIYSDLAANIEPPYPRRGLRRILDPIYYTQNKQQEQGLLDVTARVDSLGQVQQVVFYATPSKAMSKQITYILFQTKFKPALCASEPCDAEFPLLAKFRNEETLNSSSNASDQ